jgi:hypothetical protein
MGPVFIMPPCPLAMNQSESDLFLSASIQGGSLVLIYILLLMKSDQKMTLERKEDCLWIKGKPLYIPR